jgi:hypothetical protein
MFWRWGDANLSPLLVDDVVGLLTVLTPASFAGVRDSRNPRRMVLRTGVSRLPKFKLADLFAAHRDV